MPTFTATYTPTQTTVSVIGAFMSNRQTCVVVEQPYRNSKFFRIVNLYDLDTYGEFVETDRDAGEFGLDIGDTIRDEDGTICTINYRTRGTDGRAVYVAYNPDSEMHVLWF